MEGEEGSHGRKKEQLGFHTFAICAYKDSPYLEECMASVKRQSCSSEVICCTSTPSPYISRLAEKYGIPLYVREGEKRHSGGLAVRL